LTVDLMLEAFGPALTVVSAQWVPGYQTLLCVATARFVKVYDLSKD